MKPLLGVTPNSGASCVESWLALDPHRAERYSHVECLMAGTRPCPIAEKFSIELEGPVRYVGVCFRSARAPELLNHDLGLMMQFKTGAETVDALMIRPLLSDIQRTPSLDDISRRFDRFWLSRLESRGITGRSRTRISHHELIRALEESLGTDSIASICHSLCVSERQFRRLSKELFGMSPKKLQNILRLQAALQELFACEKRQIQDLYYDDSHRIRELKRLTGFTPEQIRKMAEKYNER